MSGSGGVFEAREDRQGGCEGCYGKKTLRGKALGKRIEIVAEAAPVDFVGEGVAVFAGQRLVVSHGKLISAVPFMFALNVLEDAVGVGERSDGGSHGLSAGVVDALQLCGIIDLGTLLQHPIGRIVEDALQFHVAGGENAVVGEAGMEVYYATAGEGLFAVDGLDQFLDRHLTA